MEGGRLGRAALLAMCLASPAWAEWAAVTHDDGSFYVAYAGVGKHPNPTLNLFCGSRSRQGLDPLVTGNVEPVTTPPGQVGLSFEVPFMDNSTYIPNRNDVMVVVGATGYRLPSFGYNELHGGWEQYLLKTDPLIGALKSGQPIELRSDAGGIARFEATNSGQAIDEMLAFCAAGGASLPTAPSSTDALRQAAEREIFKGCEGPAATPAPLLAGDIDRDGTLDYILDWAEFSCAGPNARPFCGAANCSVQVFLSSLGTDPIGYFAISAELKPSPLGGLEIWSYTTAGSCAEATIPAQCANILYWNGKSLERLSSR